jgi:hypothetical protein
VTAPTPTKVYRKLAMATAILEARAIGALERGDQSGLARAAIKLGQIRKEMRS